MDLYFIQMSNFILQLASELFYNLLHKIIFYIRVYSLNNAIILSIITGVEVVQMLCQFSFRNFRSYKNGTTFDFQAETLPEFSDSLITFDKASPLLPVSVIYGPNGGGKSNLLQALSCVISLVTRPVFELQKNRQHIIMQQRAESRPFLFDRESRNQPTEFELFFRRNSKEYRYLLSIFNDEIVRESLYWRTLGGKRTGTVYEREGSDIRLGSKYNSAGINHSVNPKMPYLSFLAINYNIPVIAEVQQWFESCIVLNYANTDLDKSILIQENPEASRRILHALNDMDIDVMGYRYDRDNNKIYTQRKVDGKIYELDLLDESEGTKKLIRILPMILLSLAEGRLAVIDEMDAKLHPKLLRYVISLFTNKEINTKGAQLLFTSQDMTTMKNTVFRRDEIWFAAENGRHESELYSLYEIRRENDERVNNTAAYDKQYLEGRYGADPYLRNMLAGDDWT